MYSVLNTLSEYTFFYISKNITSYTFLLIFKIVESLPCILNTKVLKKSCCLVYIMPLSGDMFFTMSDNPCGFYVIVRKNCRPRGTYNQ